ncbi:hypothetical protein NIES4102_01170 [Chondrocystis sp. NIES-4102]|nr:hypothetical protein NIES4102_01170 [Chondrocystis sp. NIES-4102]
MFRQGDILLVSKVFVLLALVRLGLWRVTFSNLRRFLLSIQTKYHFFYRCNSIEKLIWAVNVSSRYMPGNVKCLARALTTEVLLSCNDYAANLKIGVAKENTGKLEAHAWVESQGRVLIGDLTDLDRYRILPLPPLDLKP